LYVEEKHKFGGKSIKPKGWGIDSCSGGEKKGGTHKAAKEGEGYGLARAGMVKRPSKVEKT